MLDPTIYAIPIFVLTMVIEAVVLARQRQPYWAKDTAASLSGGLGQVVINLWWKGVAFLALQAVYKFRLFTFETGALAWAATIIAEDFSGYWYHRASHEIRLFWATHIAHHSSQRFTLATALRQSWTAPFVVLLFWLPLPLFGFRPWMILIAHAFNLLYQYWIHTELIDKMGWFEWFFNTPSHHRVHHGSNPQYIDKNYGNILIIWDRMFGTFEPEGEKVVYGLTKNIRTFNPFTIQFHELMDIWREFWKAKGWRVKWERVFGHPAFLKPL